MTIGVQPSRMVRGDTPRLQQRPAVVPLEGRDEKDELDPLAEAGGPEVVEPGEVEKEKLLRKREVLLQQPVGEERPSGIGQHPLVLGETDRPERGSRQKHRLALRRRRGVADDDSEAVVAEQLVEREHQVGVAAQMEPQGLELELLERQFRKALELQPERRGGLEVLDRRATGGQASAIARRRR